MPPSGNAGTIPIRADNANRAQIDRAGKHLAALRTAAIDGEVDLAALTPEERTLISTDVELIEGWRERHAGPLRNASANLRDYVREPKDDGYRALHLIVVKQGAKIEVQVRTRLQDFWANQVEYDTRRLQVDYKSGKGHDAVHAYYVGMSELLAMTEASTMPSDDFRAELRRRYMLAEPFLASLHDGKKPWT
jgi:Region found in RelA / SpoT proteins